jgi:bla regulator protein BlaR1
MPELFTILIKVNIALVLFCAGYFLVLRKLTFYTLNRVYLITAIVFSSVYPFIDLSVLAQRHQEIVAPVQNVVVMWQVPAQNFVKQAAYWNWLEILFWAGAALFALRLLFQLVSLYKIYRRSTAGQINGQTVRVVKADISPFSFWQSIYINPEKLSSTDLKNIMEHEQVHVSEWHTLDVLLTEISVIFYWFNPGIWMIKRAVRENIEFITDRKILQKGLDSKAYQYSLLNITFNQPAPAITSNFNFSTLKKRIQMMNAKRSSNLNLTRYAFLMPVVVVCLFTFSLSKAEVVKTGPAIKVVTEAVENIKIAFNADTTPVRKRVTKTTATKKTNATGAATSVTNAAAEKLVEKVRSTLENVKKEPSIRIRNLGHGDSIVYIIDGKIASAGSFNNLNFNHVESVNVIKDNATAYLSRIPGAPVAADKSLGVIVVTTKKGLTGAVTPSAGTNEVQVVGYGVNRNVDITGTTKVNTNAQEVVVQGFKINRNDESTTKAKTNTQEVVVQGFKINPDDKSTRIRLRDNTLTITGDTTKRNLAAPIIIVDGKIATDKAFDQVNQDDIESMTVLKGSTAAGLYGEKAKNGAIIITTKKK